jgi:pimeloyl-ACP methyl ester carboxylesterase
MVAVTAVFGTVIVLVGAAGGFYVWNNTTYAVRYRDAATRAGYIEQAYTLPSGTRLNYAEGPANGPAVLLVHGQGGAWESYASVLPRLAREFHVIAVDVAGHGSSSRTPGRYDVHTIGTDIAIFVEEVVGEPVILSGHSSGGLIAAWVAANEPAQVAAVLFEDPPFFSTEADRMPQQFNFIDLATPAHEFLQQDADSDFATWYVEHNAWIRYFGHGREGIARFARNYRNSHPDEPLNIWFLPPSVNKSFQYMHEFDPAFADAFYVLDWQRDFDQQATLAAVQAPSILVHANWKITDTGILEGAMTDDDASRACAALPRCRIERVDTGHSFHDENPGLFIDLVRQLHNDLP